MFMECLQNLDRCIKSLLQNSSSLEKCPHKFFSFNNETLIDKLLHYCIHIM